MVDYFIKIGNLEERNIRTYYGVHVSGSTGLVGKPPFKEPKRFSWDHLNGEWIDLSTRRYKPREITLRCWIETYGGAGRTNAEAAAVGMMNTFLKAFDSEDLVRLRIRFGSDDINNNFYWLVYLKDNAIKYKWKRMKQIVEFELTLVEPQPEKLVYKRTYSAGTVSVSYSSPTEFEINWGDGYTSYDLVGNNKTVSHTYAAGTYIVMVSGVTNDIIINVPSSNGGNGNSNIVDDDTNSQK